MINRVTALLLPIEDDNKLKEGVSVTGYKIFTRKDNALKFSAKYKGTDISEDVEINASNVDECIDIRAADIIFRRYGKGFKHCNLGKNRRWRFR